MSKFLVAAVAMAATAMTGTEAVPMAKYSMMPETNIKAMFADHMMTHGRVYESADELRVRYETFKANLKVVDELNAQNPEAKFGPTKFSDMSAAEFKVHYLMPNKPANLGSRGRVANLTELEHRAANRRVDASAADGGIDWQPQTGKFILPTQDQEQCGSCWAFSVMQNIASANAIAGNELEVLSVQQIVDCDSTSYGCRGGWADHAYEAVEKMGGLETAESYPYTARDGQCNIDKDEISEGITSWHWIAQNEGSSSDEAIQAMKTAVATQPLSVCVAATTWQHYQGGVLTSCDNQIDHCVILDGYTTGADGETPAWSCLNSWGADWGERDGRIRVAMGSNLCMLQSTVSTAVVDNN